MAIASSRRTRPRKGDVRQQKILDVTERLLERRSFSDLTMDEIARAAGLLRPSLYFYFESKEAVLSALFERTHAALMAPMAAIQASPPPSLETFRAAFEVGLDNWRKHTSMLRTFFETAMVAPEFGARWRRGIEEAIDGLSALIDQERVAGRASRSPRNTRSLASAIVWGGQHAIYELFRRKHTRAEEAELVETLTFLSWHALGRCDDDAG